MESQTFQAFVKARLKGVSSSPLSVLKLFITTQFTAAHCCFTASLSPQENVSFYLLSQVTCRGFIIVLLRKKLCMIWVNSFGVVMVICCTCTNLFLSLSGG